MAVDQFGRNIHYLRVSLTDKCNYRCVYCLGENASFLPNDSLMSDEELLELIAVFAELGFDKFRLTGGEPTVHPHIVDLVRAMHALPGVRTLSMTTNGARLKELATPLAEAGLERVNISLDTTDPTRFHRLTRRGTLDDVWAGIRAAERAGLTPIKLNTVVVRGMNDDDVTDLARLTLEHSWQVRFIELMPFGEMATFAQNYIVTEHEILNMIEDRFGTLETIENGKLNGEARLYQIAGAAGTIGVISSVSQPFCEFCTRVRLTADGVLRLCLLRDDEVNLLQPLRAGATRDELKQIICDAVWRKPKGHGLADELIPVSRLMGQIGG